MLLVGSSLAWGGDAASLATALAAPGDGRTLPGLAVGWDAAGLLTAMRSDDATFRRGAARLSTVVEIPVTELMTALRQSQDLEAQRLAVPGLLGRLTDVPIATCLTFTDPAIVCILLLNHPGDVLADKAVDKQMRVWLRDAQACGEAARVIAARGTAAGWGPELVALLDDQQETVVATAHATLCQLTRIQLSLANYGGHTELLVQDWTDRLSQVAPVAGAVDEQLLVLVADLPADAALVELLAKGPSALMAVEQAMAGATRTRRRELGEAARLLQRSVSPELWRSLGAKGLAGMDAPTVAERVSALVLAAQTVTKTNDQAGLLHVLSYTDDRDATVRCAALDRLVRLGDQASAAEWDWSLNENGALPMAQAGLRLRRALKEGGADEQVSALQLIGSLKAADMGHDVAALLLAPDAMVADTARETLAHLGGNDHLGLLAKIVADRNRPVEQRVTLMKMLAEKADDLTGTDAKTKATVAALRTLLSTVDAEGDPALVRVAVPLRLALCRTSVEVKTTIEGLLAQSASVSRIAGLQALSLRELSYTVRQQVDKVVPPLAMLALPLLSAPEPEVVAAAAQALATALDADERRVQMTKALAAARPQLADLARSATGPAVAPVLAIAVRLGALAPDDVVARLGSLSGETAEQAWVAALDAGLSPLLAASVLRSATVSAQVGGQMLSSSATVLLLHEDLLLEVARTDDLYSLRGVQHQSSSSGRQRTATLTFPDGGKLLLSTTGAAVEDRQTWVIDARRSTAAPTSAASVAALCGALAELRFADHEQGAWREVMLAVSAMGATPLDLAAVMDQRTWIHLLLVRRPEVRPQVVAALSAGAELSYWEVKSLIEAGNPDLLAVMLRVAAAKSNASSLDEIATYLASLTPADLAPHLATIAAHAPLARQRSLAKAWRAAGAVPWPLALKLIQAGLSPLPAIAPIAVVDASALAEALSALPTARLGAWTTGLEALRTAGPEAMTAALTVVVARQDDAAIAWLRSGLPLKAGLTQVYREALTSTVPQRWLVGAAMGLKDGTLTKTDFLAKVAAYEVDQLGAAGQVASKYLGLPDPAWGDQLAIILAKAPARSLDTWIGVSPPTAAVAKALAERAADGTTAGIIGFSLRKRLAADRDGWEPHLATIAAKAGGRLDSLGK